MLTVEKDYPKLASRTESHNFEGKKYNKEMYLESLNLAVVSAQLLDIFKKNFFYNRAYTQEQYQEAIQNLKKTIEILEKHNIQQSQEGDVIHFEEKDIDSLRLYHMILGVVTEGGEIGEALQAYQNGAPLDWVNIAEENGDIDWYQAIPYNILAEKGENLTELDVRTKNINKLAKRYGEKFTDYHANNRDLDAERKILES